MRATPTPYVTLGPADSTCIPKNGESRIGKAIEVMDGNTVRVLMQDNGLIYYVRYIGVEVPTDPAYGLLAEQKNIELVYMKEITLLTDTTPKDDRGRLLYYVIAGDTFINLEMIKQGLGSALDVPPNSSCAQSFSNGEQAARTSQLGIWSVISIPTP